MALDVELVVDGGMNREELLRRAWRSKASTLSFPLPGWLARDLGRHCHVIAPGREEVAG